MLNKPLIMMFMQQSITMYNIYYLLLYSYTFFDTTS